MGEYFFLKLLEEKGPLDLRISRDSNHGGIQ